MKIFVDNARKIAKDIAVIVKLLGNKSSWNPYDYLLFEAKPGIARIVAKILINSHQYMTVIYTLPPSTRILEPGMALFKPRKLLQMLLESRNGIEISDSITQVVGCHAKEYSYKVPSFTSPKAVIDTNLVSEVMHASDNYNTRVHLNHVLLDFNHGEIVACIGTMLAVRNGVMKADIRVMVHHFAAKAASGIKDNYFVYADQDTVMLKSSKCMIFHAQANDTYPDYRKELLKDVIAATITVKRVDLLRAIKVLRSIPSAEPPDYVHVYLRTDGLVLLTDDGNETQFAEVIDCQSSVPPPLGFEINIKYFRNAVAAIKTESVVIKSTGKYLKPLLFLDETHTLKEILAPARCSTNERGYECLPEDAVAEV